MEKVIVSGPGSSRHPPVSADEQFKCADAIPDMSSEVRLSAILLVVQALAVSFVVTFNIGVESLFRETGSSAAIIARPAFKGIVVTLVETLTVAIE